VSKVWELGDTIFIVLRKQPLIFLHWYHHITVLIYVWYSYMDHTAPGRWFIIVNYSVHALMYTYYTLKALRFKLPRSINVMLTTIQILQMILGLAVNLTSYSKKSRGDFCQQTDSNLLASVLMYFSYFILFSHFFYTNYVQPKPRSKHQAAANGETRLSSDKKSR